MENISEEISGLSDDKNLEPDTVPPSPNNPPWGPGSALFLWIISVALIMFMPLIFLFPYLFSQEINLTDQAEFSNFILNDTTAIMLQMAAVIPAHLVTLLIAWFIVTNRRKYSFTEMLGWKWGGYKWWHTIVLLLVVFGVAVGMTEIFGQRDNELLRILRKSRYVVFLVAFMATFSAPIVEEVVYRGVLYSAFKRSFGVAAAVGLVTLVFALVHFPQYWGDYATLITLTFLSLVITLIRVRTDNLLPCIFFHFVVNGIQSIVLILQPYFPELLESAEPAKAFFILIQ